jgi:hypothetical protein
METVGARVDSLDFNLRELIARDYLSDYAVNGIERITFHTRVLCHSYGGTRFFPNPVDYIDMDGERLTNDDIRDFVSVVSSPAFSLNLNESFIEKRCSRDSEYIESAVRALGLVHRQQDVFVHVLYFILYTSEVVLRPVRTIMGSTGWKTVNAYDKLMEFSSVPGTSRMMYHGTQPSFVYSILRTKGGLKSLSGTRFQANGCAQGNGIYCAADASTAVGYSHYNGYVLVLRCKNAGTESVAVLQNNEVLVCGLIEFAAVPSAEVLNEIATTVYNATEVLENPMTERRTLTSEFACTDMGLRVNTTTSPYSDEATMASKRIRKELTPLFSRSGDRWSPELDATIGRMNFAEPANVLSPLLIEVLPSVDSPLFMDLLNAGLHGVIVSVHFGQKYPLEPPTFRLVYPRMQTWTGHITNGGSVCMSTLYVGAGWSPALGVSELVLAFADMISNSTDGCARLAQDYDRVYDYASYAESFARVGHSHEWV